MFESNFPVDKECVSYRTLWNAFKRISAKAGLSESEKTQMFSGTAARAYRLPEIDWFWGGSPWRHLELSRFWHAHPLRHRLRGFVDELMAERLLNEATLKDSFEKYEEETRIRR